MSPDDGSRLVTRAFVIGVQRCGTSYLYGLLDDHPEISMAKPLRPEPKIFLDDLVTNDPAGYDARLFGDAPPTPVRGEKSTSYLEHDRSINRILATFPESRFLVMLRDPVARALSHYRFSVDNGLEPRAPDRAIIDDLERRPPPPATIATSVSPFAYVRRGDYLESLQRLERQVPPDRTSVLVLEDIEADHDAIGDVYRFLGVDPSHRPEAAGKSVNRSDVSVRLQPTTEATLRAYFSPLNAALSRHLDRPLDRWS